MGPFERLASRWMPEIRYGDHLMHEVESVAWDCTVTGTRRGFVVGLTVGLFVVAIVGVAIYTTGAYKPLSRVDTPGTGAKDTREAEALRAQVIALRDENRALKRQLERASVAASISPGPPQTTGKEPSDARASAPAPRRAPQGAPGPTAAPKASVVALAGQTGQAPSSTQEVEPPREVLTLAPPTSVTRTDTAPRSPSLGMAIAEVRTSQGDGVSGVPIAFQFLDDGDRQIGGTTVPTNRTGRSTAAIPIGTACAEYRLPEEYLQAGRVKPAISPATGRPMAAGVFRTCGGILAHPNGIIGVFTID